MRVIKHIPNTITSMNLLSGILGVIFALDGNSQAAFILMLAAACFDFCDGLAARLLGAYSDLGKELDSLSDMVSFGVLPAVMLYCSMGSCGWPRYIPLAIAVFSALRLAKFNLDERQHCGFIGLPTPACAMICGSLACFADASPNLYLAELCNTCWFIPVVAVVLSFLLVSEIPMFSMKFGKGTSVGRRVKVLRIIFLVAAALSICLTAILRQHWSLVILMTFSAYILLNIIFPKQYSKN
ncbi:MAG: CDP-diacylglycerol--serine O-phosphatidyltransferase [Candidatus Cryptobacteroides sp.]